MTSRATPKRSIQNSPVQRSSRALSIWIGLIIALAVIAIYAPVNFHDFVNYDDPDYVYANSHINGGLTLAGLRWAFGHIAGDTTYWHPLTWVSHMIDCELFGLQPGPHHMVNVAFHALNSVLVFLFLSRLTGAVWLSGALAMIFGLHPVQVDTVAWVAERKNLLSTCFWLLTMIAYLRYVRSVGERKRNPVVWYVVIILLYACGLMSKPMLVTVPCVLLLLDFWPLRRFENTKISRLLIEKAPLFAMALASGIITILAHRQLHSFIPVDDLSFVRRLNNAVMSYFLYCIKCFWPAKLSVYYPIPHAFAPLWLAIGSAVLIVTTALVLWKRRSAPYLSIGWFWFLGTLVPVIGIWQVGMQLIAERFVYVPLIGILIAMGCLVVRVFPKPLYIMLSLIVVAAAAIKTAQQLHVWQNSCTLFQHVVAVIGPNPLAETNLGAAYAANKQWEEAEYHCRVATALDPKFYLPHKNLGEVLTKKKAFDAADKEFAITMELNPACYQAEYSWGNMWIERGMALAALPHYLKAVKIMPTSAESHYQLGVVYAPRDAAKAALHWREAVRLRPNWPEALNNLAWLLATSSDDSVRKADEALAYADAVARIPGTRSAEMLDTYAAALAAAGYYDLAVAREQEAIGLARDVNAAQVFATRLTLYQNKQPYREP